MIKASIETIAKSIKARSFFIYLAMLTMFTALTTSCATSQPKTLYEALGGESGIESISGRLIAEIGADPEIRQYFLRTNLDRFHAMFSEHLCAITDGPCTYTGDNMLQVHQGMNIDEAHFNLTVDLLIEAMNQERIPHRVQNQLIARLAPLRKEIIYR